jgi:hypothetical protein
MTGTAKVINQHGEAIDFAAACNLMDSAIAADMDYGDGLTEQEFYNAYCLRHLQKYGDEFELDKPNPVW